MNDAEKMDRFRETKLNVHACYREATGIDRALTELEEYPSDVTIPELGAKLHALTHVFAKSMLTFDSLIQIFINELAFKGR